MEFLSSQGLPSSWGKHMRSWDLARRGNLIMGLNKLISGVRVVLEGWWGRRLPLLSDFYGDRRLMCITCVNSIKLRGNIFMMRGTMEVQKDALGCKEQIPTALMSKRGSWTWGCRELCQDSWLKKHCKAPPRTSFFLSLLLPRWLLPEAGSSPVIKWLPLLTAATDFPMSACPGRGTVWLPRSKEMSSPKPPASQPVQASHWPKVT